MQIDKLDKVMNKYFKRDAAMKKLLIYCAVMFVTTTAGAVDMSGYKDINRLYVWDGTEAHIWISGNNHTCSDQTYPSRYLLRATFSGDNLDELTDKDRLKFSSTYSLLLASFVSDIKVRLRYTCIQGKPFVTSVRADN